MNWYLSVLKNYVGFSGRARRKEYWMFTLVSMLVTLFLSGTETALELPPVLSVLYALGTFLPALALSFRRLHDTGRSAAWLLIGLVPLVGWIVVLVFMCLPGDRSTNAYGPSPKGDAPYAMAE